MNDITNLFTERPRKLKELSFFTGGGGGILATHYILGWDCIGYVEWEKEPQRIIKQRIKQGQLPNAPIFGDIRTFISEGYAAQYAGHVDVITGGFPCVSFSTAGKQLGASDPRNMWPDTINGIRIIRPKYVFLENVSALRSAKGQRIKIQQVDRTLFGERRSSYEKTVRLPSYFGRVLGDLAESGYDSFWKVVSAEEVGAPHLRERVWILATDPTKIPNPDIP